MPRRALIVSGGGSKGAYAVGAVDYMVNTKGLTFDVVCGTSTGALIAPMVVSGHIDELVDVYSRVSTEDVLAEREGLGNVLKSVSLYKVEPLLKILTERITAGRADAIINSTTVQMFLTTVSLQEGSTVYFSTGPAPKIAPGTQVIRITDRATLIKAALASACIPVFMPPVTIPANANPVRQYADGGVRDVAPLKIAVDQGVDELYVVLLGPKTRKPTNNRYADIPSILLRTIQMFEEEVMKNDVEIVERDRQAVQYVASIKHAIQTKFGLTDDDVDTIFNPVGITNPFAGRNPFVMNVIQPDTSDDVPTDALDFTAAEMRKMVDRGRKRAEEVLGGP